MKRGRGDARLYLYATVAVVAIVIVARIIAERQIAEQRRERRGSRRSGEAAADLWRVAGSAAEAGLFADACHAVYAAVLSDLSHAGAFRLHTSKTGGDYARELQRRGYARANGLNALRRGYFALGFRT